MRFFLAIGIALAAACSSEPQVDSIDQAVCNCEQTPAPCCCNSPIVIDVAGDGIELTSWTDGVMFAMRPEKPPGERAWTHEGSDDAWLVLDRNGDELINDGSELFGDKTPQPPPPDGQLKNGFAALAEYDDNGDRVIGRNDKVFESLRLWQDRNHDGVSQPGELLTLSMVGIAGLSLDYVEDKRADEHGNAFKYRAAVHGTPGSTVGMTAWDVWLTGPIGKPKPGEQASVRSGSRQVCTCRCPLVAKPGVSQPVCNVPNQPPPSNLWPGQGEDIFSEEVARKNCRNNAWNSAGASRKIFCVKPNVDLDHPEGVPPEPPRLSCEQTCQFVPPSPDPGSC
jgi:hypothetical protein